MSAETRTAGPAEARCPMCLKLLFRFTPRVYGPDSETTQTATDTGLAVEVKCGRCRSTITFSVPSGAILAKSEGVRAPLERRSATTR